MRAFALLVLSLAMPVLATPVEEVRRAEIGFAKAFADRDKAKFFSYVAEDATFLGSLSTSIGKQQVIERWSRFFEGPQAPFSWGPERVSVSADGTLGLSTGPVHDPKGLHSGDYISTWRKQSDGTWKIVFDSSGPGPALLAERVVPSEEGFITTADGAKLYYRKVGDGPVKVIAPLDFTLHPFLRQLSTFATVVTYDLRGRGKSSKVTDPKTMSIQQDVRDLEAVRAHLEIGKFTPIGWSYLGKMVVMYALAHPDRVQRIVQLGPVANRATRNQSEDIGAPPDADVKRWQELREQGAREKTPREYCVAQWNVFRYYLTGSANAAALFDVKGTCDLENEWPLHFERNIASLWPTIEPAISDDDLKKITVPVLTIHGTKDRNARYEGGKEWANTLSNARLVTLDGAAHAMWLDDPAGTFAAIRQFLRGEWPLGSE